ncbi:SIMPL domain-containing protein [Sphingoaurantiacus capsulatus]|uniref:SIMPL domain-containing protein n=1 Tax=Sphingoaurantiacus capsulatus TaxID=1771310 RepID=A0ABV7X8L1_9SPHN
MTDSPRANSLVIAAAILAGGMIAGGGWLGHNIAETRLADRSVTVRGLAERDVTADLATWTLAFSSTGNDVAPVQAKIDRDTAAIRAYLKRYGFADAEVATAGVSVNQWVDNNPAYGTEGRRNVTVRQRLQLRTTKVMDARRAAAGVSELVRAGVALEEGSNVTYSFTRLESVKPAMIATATRDARRGAEQFAKDSGSGVGGIKHAAQGYFSVGPRDGEGGSERGGADTPFQKVRVVTTIDFYLD